MDRVITKDIHNENVIVPLKIIIIFAKKISSMFNMYWNISKIINLRFAFNGFEN